MSAKYELQRDIKFYSLMSLCFICEVFVKYLWKFCEVFLIFGTFVTCDDVLKAR